MVSLSQDQSAILDDVVHEVGGLADVCAVALGGSHARNRAHTDSDIDIGIYYRERAPFSIESLREIARRLDDSGDPVVSELGGWGPWVNGGAWLTIRGQRVDLLYRSLELCDRVIRDAGKGRYELHYAQQAPFGFFSPTYLGEIHVAVALRDDASELESRKRQVVGYPDALRRSVMQSCLWDVEFGLNAFRRCAGSIAVENAGAPPGNGCFGGRSVSFESRRHIGFVPDTRTRIPGTKSSMATVRNPAASK